MSRDNSKTFLTSLAYSLPRVIANAVEHIFVTYLGDLYIHTYEWRPKDFGTLTCIYSSTLGISHIILGFLFNFLIDKKSADSKDDKPLKTSKAITVVSIGVHSLTFFLLVLLPFIWSGKRAVFLDLAFMKGIEFLNTVFRTSLLGCIRGSSSSPSKEVPFIQVDPGPPPDLGLDATRGPPAVSTAKMALIYSITVFHAAGFASFELCNRAIPTYIYGNNEEKLNIMNGVNLGIYASSDFIMNVVISLVKFFFHDFISEGEFFLLISTALLFFQAPFLYCFHNFTQKCEDGHGPAQEQVTPNQNSERSTTHWSKLISVIIFHAPAHFCIVMAGPLAQYISHNLLGGDRRVKNFGPLVLLGCATLSTVAYTIAKSLDPKKSTSRPKCSTDVEASEEMIITFSCIAGYTFVYFLFFSYNFGWNSGNYIHFVLFATCGVIFGLFLLNVSNLIDYMVETDRFKQYKWIVIGIFFSYTQFVVSLTSFLLYNVYDNEKIIQLTSPRFTRRFVFSFKGVYKLIVFIFQILNFVGACVYFEKELKAFIVNKFLDGEDDTSQYKAFTKQIDSSIYNLDKMLEILEKIQ